MLPAGRPRAVDDRRLDGEHVGLLRGPAVGGAVLAGDGLGQVPGDVDRPRAADVGVGPRHRLGEDPVDLEDARAVLVARHPAPVAVVHPVPGHPHERPRGGVQQHRGHALELAQVGHLVTGDQLAALLLEGPHHRVGQLLRPALDQRPAAVVRQHPEQHAEGRGQRPGQVEHPVRGRTGQQRLALLGVEVPPGQPPDVRQAGQPEARHLDGALRGQPAQHAGEEEVDDVLAVLDQRLEQPAVGGGVRRPGPRPSPPGSGGDRRPAAVERMGVATSGCTSVHPAAGEVELAEERRDRGHRVHGGADVVPDAGGDQLLGAHAPARAVGGLDELHAQAGGRQPQRGGQPVGSRSDDDGVRLA